VQIEASISTIASLEVDEERDGGRKRFEPELAIERQAPRLFTSYTFLSDSLETPRYVEHECMILITHIPIQSRIYTLATLEQCRS
jgi:hypothetical protein